MSPDVSFRRIVRMLAIMLSLLWSGCSYASDTILFQKLLTMAKQGNAEAQYNVGMMLNNGIGTEKNPGEAFEWFQKAADSGDPLGAYKLGCYFGGQFNVVAPADHGKELHYKLIAATAGYSLAQHDVGVIYYQQKNFSAARHWLELAAKQGYPMSLYALSTIYYKGQDVKQNRVLTYAYFKLAKLRAEGRINPRAQDSLDGLKTEMSPEEIQKAERMVSEWQAIPTPLTVRAAEGIDGARKLVGIAE